jgi:nitrogen-specific signal transduction histidine kinase
MQSFTCSSKWLAVTLSSEAHITSLSSGAEQFAGYSAQELVGLPLTQILDKKSALEVPFMLDVATELGYWVGEVIHSARGGKSIAARGMMYSLAGKGNSSAGYLLISNPNKSLEPNNEEASAIAEIADTLRTLAHDLNNPLAVIMGFTQLIVLNENCQGQIRSDIEKIYSELKRVIQVVEELHGYARSLYQKPHFGESSGNTARHA